MKKFLWMTFVVLLVVSAVVLTAAASAVDGGETTIQSDANSELSVQLSDVGMYDDRNGNYEVHSLFYTVALIVDGVNVESTDEPITFRLPVPGDMAVGDVVDINYEGEYYTSDIVKEHEGRKSVKVTASEFGVFTLLFAHEHSYRAVVTPPTCTEVGYTTYICACGDSYTGDATDVTKHEYKAVVTAPTCTTKGYTTHTCTGCGHTYVDTPTATTTHQYSGNTCVNCGDILRLETVVLADYVYAQAPHNTASSKKLGQRYDIGETYLKKIVISQMATFTANENSWTLKVWRWNTDYGTTVSAVPLFVTYGINFTEGGDFVVVIPDNYQIHGDIFYEVEYTSGTATFTGWADNGTYQSGLETYLAGVKKDNHYGSKFVVQIPTVFDSDPPSSGDSDSSIPDDPDVIILADRAGGSSPQTAKGDFFGQRFDIGSNTLKQLVIKDLVTYFNNVNTWEIKFWQWDTNQPITVSGTPIYTATGSNHTDSADFVLDIPDSITLTGEIYYEIYYRSGNTGFAGWNALGDHYDSLHTYVNGSEVNTHIASYIRVNFSDTPDETETDAPTGELNVKQEDLKEIMQNVFDGTISLKETVMFIEKNTTKDLLFPINSVISVTSYDGKTTYLEGRDYEIVNGQLKITANSTMPAITSAVYYNYDGSLISKDGKNLYWGESMMKQWQVSVTYTHADNWSGFEQETQYEVYKDFVQKLANGEDVTVMFYGDSITWGANSTFAEGVQPKQGAYAMLFTEALADLFGYTVKYVNTGLTCHSVQTVPTTEYVAGNRGTITYVNTAVGGWTSTDGVTYFDEHIKSQFNTYGCDLFVVAFGMNDSGMLASSTKSNVKSIIDKMYQLNSKASVMIVSTMTPHSGTNWDNNNIKGQETQLTALASTYQSSGKAVAVAQVNSVSVAVQTRKGFNDYAGNNVNHPNDWFYRVYAQTLLQTLIGYENMD